MDGRKPGYVTLPGPSIPYVYIDALQGYYCKDCGSEIIVTIEKSDPLWESRVYCGDAECGRAYGRVKRIMPYDGVLSLDGRQSVKRDAIAALYDSPATTSAEQP